MDTPVLTSWKSSPTISLLAAALVKAQASMTNPHKTSRNPFFNSKYADLAEVRESCLPDYNANGISVMQHPTTTDVSVEVETLLLHESGEWISSRLGMFFTAKKVKGQMSNPDDPPERDAQPAGVLITYCRRYALQSIACLAAEDDDGETAMGRGKQQAQPEPQSKYLPAADPFPQWKKQIDGLGEVPDLNRFLPQIGGITEPALKTRVWNYTKEFASQHGLAWDATLKLFIQPTK